MGYFRMKKFRRFLLWCIFIFLILFLLRGWLFRKVNYYTSTGPRDYTSSPSPELIQWIDQHTKDIKPEISDIIDESLHLAADQLAFTTEKCETDPNKLFLSHKTNCIGYAAFFSTVCNQMIKENKLQQQWIATPHIGQLYFFGINIHPYFKSKFWKDHDFVLVENKMTGERIAVDPSLYDYSGITTVRYKKESR